MPDVPIIINGGIASLSEAKAHLFHVDGVMLGRAAYQEPWRLLAADPDDTPVVYARRHVVRHRSYVASGPDVALSGRYSVDPVAHALGLPDRPPHTPCGEHDAAAGRQ